MLIKWNKKFFIQIIKQVGQKTIIKSPKYDGQK